VAPRSVNCRDRGRTWIGGFDVTETTLEGFCHCGCGQKTKLASRTNKQAGWVKGQPLRYLRGHSGGKLADKPLVPCAYCRTLIYPIWKTGGPRKYCDRECWRAAHKATRTPAEQQRDAKLLRFYGINGRDGYEEILASQGGGCAICGRTSHGTGQKRLYVDHDHKTQAVRGVLCASCNRAIGLMQDDPERLRNAAEYLDRAIKRWEV
jgi:hypothetical protein